MARKKKKNSAYFAFLFLILICVILLVFNVKIWQERVKNREHLKSVEDDFNMLYGEADTLQLQVVNEEDGNLIERVAREQLLLRKEGESVVVISRTESLEEEEEVEEVTEDTFFQRLMDIIR